jgi:hypothetical protein
MLVVIGIDYIGSYKPNYQTITMAPNTPEVSMLTNFMIFFLLSTMHYTPYITLIFLNLTLLFCSLYYFE